MDLCSEGMDHARSSSIYSPRGVQSAMLIAHLLLRHLGQKLHQRMVLQNIAIQGPRQDNLSHRLFQFVERSGGLAGHDERQPKSVPTAMGSEDKPMIDI